MNKIWTATFRRATVGVVRSVRYLHVLPDSSTPRRCRWISADGGIEGGGGNVLKSAGRRRKQGKQRNEWMKLRTRRLTSKISGLLVVWRVLIVFQYSWRLCGAPYASSPRIGSGRSGRGGNITRKIDEWLTPNITRPGLSCLPPETILFDTPS